MVKTPVLGDKFYEIDVLILRIPVLCALPEFNFSGILLKKTTFFSKNARGPN